MTIRQQSIEWMARNPSVVRLFEEFAEQLVERNRRFGINLLRERVRWECVYSYGHEDYKFCNTFSPYVARYLLWKHPSWADNMRCKLTKDEEGTLKLITDAEINAGRLGAGN